MMDTTLMSLRVTVYNGLCEALTYICAYSSRTILGRLDENAAWFEFHQVAHLFGMKLERAAKFFRQVVATGEINAERDVRPSDRSGCLLSHRAVVAVGYHMN